MKAQETNAARELQASGDVSPHRLISLLMAGLLERAGQAKESLVKGDTEAEEVLLPKVVGIINGLRDCLDFDQGGEIAVNLNNLYDYMISRIDTAEDISSKKAALSEIENLVSEIKSGWDGVEQEVAA